MSATIYWLGGWASSLECWEPMLREQFPEFEHSFPDTHVLLDRSPMELGLHPSWKERGDVVAAWSMGSLLAHQWIDRGLWPVDLPLLSLCPVFRFLRPEGFGQPVLLRMEKKLGVDHDAVLRDFWRRMPKAGEIPEIWGESWIQGTRNYSDETLIHGLEFLRTTVVEASALRNPPCRWELLAGDRDLLAPAPAAESLPSGALLHIYTGGHLPFWECPDEMRACFNRLTSA
jgi:hypothetical protein